MENLAEFNNTPLASFKSHATILSPGVISTFIARSAVPGLKPLLSTSINSVEKPEIFEFILKYTTLGKGQVASFKFTVTTPGSIPKSCGFRI